MAKKKTSFGPDFAPFGPNWGCHFPPPKIWLRQSLDLMVRYHHVQYQKKINDPILRKLSDGRTDGPTDRRTVGQERFHRTLPV